MSTASARKTDLDHQVEAVGKEIVLKKKRDRWLAWILVVSVILHFLTLALIYAPVTVISYSNLPFPTDREIYHAGDGVAYTVSYCKRYDAPGTVSRSLEYNTGQTIAVQQVSTTGTVGCKTSTVLSFVIPPQAPSGMARIVSTNVYDGFLFRKQTIRTYTRYFLVIRP